MQKLKLTILLVLSFSVICALASFYGVTLPDKPATSEKTRIIIGNTLVYVDIADTPALREQGLSGRHSLKDNEGMLFIFDSPEKPGFWMREMLFPIDIIWISADMRVVGTIENLLPSSYPRIFSPKTEITYVLEVPSGFVEKKKVEVGVRAVIQ